MHSPEELAHALDSLIPANPTLLALGEPVHGVEAFPLLRNEIFRHLVGRGFRSIALETDFFAAHLVNDYVTLQSDADLDEVLETGFSHHFGRLPGNRELVEWLRAHNVTRSPRERVTFHGFDAPTEFEAAPSPRVALETVRDFLPEALRPDTPDLDELLGDEADWTNPAAMYDPAASIGGEERVRDLRIIADDLAGAFTRAAPAISRNPGYHKAKAYARTAQSLLRYHVAMAGGGPGRMSELIAIRAEMMAGNLLSIAGRACPTLVHAHNVHLLRTRSGLQVGTEKATWGSAGALVALELGEGYVFVATDATVAPEPGTLQAELAEATTGRTLFRDLTSARPAAGPMARGHLPLEPEDLAGADAVVFITDTDGRQTPFW